MSSNENASQSSEAGNAAQKLSPEMVRKVSDRVYQLLKEEMRVDRERLRPAENHRRFGQGGR